MDKLVILKFGQVSFETGFPVTLRLGNEGEPASLELDGWLSAAPVMTELAALLHGNCSTRLTSAQL